MKIQHSRSWKAFSSHVGNFWSRMICVESRYSGHFTYSWLSFADPNYIYYTITWKARTPDDGLRRRWWGEPLKSVPRRPRVWRSRWFGEWNNLILIYFWSSLFLVGLRKGSGIQHLRTPGVVETIGHLPKPCRGEAGRSPAEEFVRQLGCRQEAQWRLHQGIASASKEVVSKEEAGPL